MYVYVYFSCHNLNSGRPFQPLRQQWLRPFWYGLAFSALFVAFEHLDYSQMFPLFCLAKRCYAIILLGFNVSPLVKEQPGYFWLSVSCSRMKCCFTSIIFSFNISSSVKKQFRCICISKPSCNMKCCFIIITLSFNIGSLVKK